MFFIRRKLETKRRFLAGRAGVLLGYGTVSDLRAGAAGGLPGGAARGGVLRQVLHALQGYSVN